MTNKAAVNTNHIQRNLNDVAIELLLLHERTEGIQVSEISNLFARYYSVAQVLNSPKVSTTKEFLPEEFKDLLFK